MVVWILPSFLCAITFCIYNFGGDKNKFPGKYIMCCFNEKSRTYGPCLCSIILITIFVLPTGTLILVHWHAMHTFTIFRWNQHAHQGYNNHAALKSKGQEEVSYQSPTLVRLRSYKLRPRFFNLICSWDNAAPSIRQSTSKHTQVVLTKVAENKSDAIAYGN